MHIDLNCDMGEGVGSAETDVGIMRHISSVNIACGMHAGSVDDMLRAVELAIANDVAIGAHPGFPDKENFGRKFINYEASEFETMLSDQICTLKAMVEAAGAALQHVKPHGAIYNHAATDYDYAVDIATIVKKIDPALILVGLSNSKMGRAASDVGVRFASEVFADRRYTDDGLLVPRNEVGAVIDKEQDSFRQVEEMIVDKQLTSINNVKIEVDPQTICVHGDTRQGALFIKNIHQYLHSKNIRISPMSAFQFIK